MLRTGEKEERRMASISDTKDRHASMMAFGGLLLGLKFFADAAQALSSPDVQPVLDVAALVLALAGVLLIVPVFIWKFRHLGPAERRAYFSRESFTADVVARAQTASWNVTLLALIGLDIAYEGSPALPVEFFVHVLIGLAFVVFAGVFLVLNREPSKVGADG